MNITDQELIFCEKYIHHNFNLKEACKELGISKRKGNSILNDKSVQEYLDDKRESVIKNTGRDYKKFINILWDAVEDCADVKNYKDLKGLLNELSHVEGYRKPIETKNTTTIIEDTVKRVVLTVKEIKDE